MANKGYWVVCYKSVSNPEVVSEYAKLAAIALMCRHAKVRPLAIRPLASHGTP